MELKLIEIQNANNNCNVLLQLCEKFEIDNVSIHLALLDNCETLAKESEKVNKITDKRLIEIDTKMMTELEALKNEFIKENSTSESKLDDEALNAALSKYDVQQALSMLSEEEQTERNSLMEKHMQKLETKKEVKLTVIKAEWLKEYKLPISVTAMFKLFIRE